MGRKLDEQGLQRLVENIKGDIRESVETVKTDVVDIQSGLEENKSSILEANTNISNLQNELIGQKQRAINISIKMLEL